MGWHHAMKHCDNVSNSIGGFIGLEIKMWTDSMITIKLPLCNVYNDCTIIMSQIIRCRVVLALLQYSKIIWLRLCYRRYDVNFVYSTLSWADSKKCSRCQLVFILLCLGGNESFLRLKSV